MTGGKARVAWRSKGGWATLAAVGIVVCAIGADPVWPQQTPGGPTDGWGTTVAPSKPAPATPQAAMPIPAQPSEATPRLRPTKPPAAIPAPGAGPAPTSLQIEARAVQMSGDARRTRIAFELSAPVKFTAYRLSDPYRVVIDLEAVHFALPGNAGRQQHGLITAFRYGLFAEGKSRIVIDTTGPVRIETARMDPLQGRVGSAFTIDLVATTPTEFAAEELAAAAATVDPTRNPPPTDGPSQAPKRQRPVIVIDPGHGGIDSGAEGTLGLEKDLVLNVALEIQRALLATQRFDVVMTRTADTFVSLDQRVQISVRHHADLFLSVHADSLAAREFAQSIRGATLYVMSEKASDERSRRMAEKENAADLLAGIRVSAAPGDSEVQNILLDLMRRESATMSSSFRSLLIAQMRNKIALAKDPARSAPFRVLRQTGSPAVLIELGYISNLEDEKLMASPAWQKGVATAVATAVGEHFRRLQANRR